MLEIRFLLCSELQCLCFLFTWDKLCIENSRPGLWSVSDLFPSAMIMICYVLFCRHALEDSLERAFVPGLAAVISFIDVRGNIRMIQAPGDLNNLWLRLFSECGKLGLKYSQLTAGQQGSVS